MKLKHKIILYALSIALSISGYVMLGYFLGWKISFAVFLLMWGNDIDKKLASKE